MKLKTIPASLALGLLLLTSFSVFADPPSQENAGRISATIGTGNIWNTSCLY